MIVPVFFCVISIFSCQLDPNLESPGKGKHQLRDWPVAIDLFDIFLIVDWCGRVKHTVDCDSSWAGEPRMYKKVSWV